MGLEINKENKNKKFEEILEEYRKLFVNEDYLLCCVMRKFDTYRSLLPYVVDEYADLIVENTKKYAMKNTSKLDKEFYEVTLTHCLSKINDGMTLAGEKPDEFLPSVWKNSMEEEMLNTTYYALALMNNKFRKRAETGYLLDSNKVKIGCSGYSKKIKKFIPYYLTTFNDYIFLIDAIRGLVYRSNTRFDNAALMQVGNKVFCGDKLVAQEKEDCSTEFCFDKEPWMKDLKEKERANKRAKGHQVKETKWLSVPLGDLNSSNTYIRVHTLICLMVYGFDIVKYGLMDGSSIWSVDHSNSIHDDNSIDNLAFVTRSANSSKKDKQISVFDYFLYFLNMEQVVEEDECVEVGTATSGICVKSEDAEDEMSWFDRKLTAEEAAAKFGFIIVDV